MEIIILTVSEESRHSFPDLLLLFLDVHRGVNSFTPVLPHVEPKKHKKKGRNKTESREIQ